MAPEGTKMSARNNGKPSNDRRLWPYFAAGWNGDPVTPVTCQRCYFPCWVGRPMADPEGAQVGHIDPAVQAWLVDGESQVFVTCQACNLDDKDVDLTGRVEAVEYSEEANAASKRHVAKRRGETRVERERRVGAKRANDRR